MVSAFLQYQAFYAGLMTDLTIEAGSSTWDGDSGHQDASRVLIIGAGPSGLYLAFQLGLLDIACTMVDSLPSIGGQCYELYADKPIYDIPGFESIHAYELAKRLWVQAQIAKPRLYLNSVVTSIEGDATKGFEVAWLDQDPSKAEPEIRQCFRAVFVASGVGAFAKKRLRLEDVESFEQKQIWYGQFPTSLSNWEQAHIVVSGGGRRAQQLILSLLNEHRLRPQASLTMIARNGLRPAAGEDDLQSLREIQEACDQGRLRLIEASPRQLIIDKSAQRLKGLEIKRGKDSQANIDTLDCDQLIVCHGLSPKLEPLLHWELDMTRGQIPVDPARFESRRRGIFAIGDIASYPGKKKLIVSGFHEACLSAYAVCDYVFPGKAIPLQYTTTSPRLLAKFQAPSI